MTGQRTLDAIDRHAWIRLAERTLESVATPGHTTGHLDFFDAEAGLLFAGDHVLPHITPSVGNEVDGAPLPLQDYLRSLTAIRDLSARLVLPAHGPVFEGLAERVDELLAHHEHRLAATRAAVGTETVNAHTVARRLTWTRRERRFDDLDLENQRLAVGETGAHLDVLVARGELARDEAGPVVAYRPYPSG